MKKMILRSLLILFCWSTLWSAAFAADLPLALSAKDTCVVVIGTADVKTPDFFNYIDEAFNAESTKRKVAYGTEIQSLYQKYWLDKGHLEEQKPTKQDLHDFAQFSGYKKVLFFIVSSPTVEKTRRAAGGWGLYGGGYSMTEQTRASVSVKAFLVDAVSILKAVDATKEDDSRTSELRAKRGAFKKCITEIKDIIGASL